MEYWNVGLNKELLYLRPLTASMPSGISPITHYSISPEPILINRHKPINGYQFFAQNSIFLKFQKIFFQFLFLSTDRIEIYFKNPL